MYSMRFKTNILYVRVPYDSHSKHHYFSPQYSPIFTRVRKIAKSNY